MLTAFAMLHLTLPSFKGLKRCIHHFYPPSVSKKMSGSNMKFPSSKHNVMVSFKIMYDDFFFDVKSVRLQLESEQLRDCKNSLKIIFHLTIHDLQTLNFSKIEKGN